MLNKQSGSITQQSDTVPVLHNNTTLSQCVLGLSLHNTSNTFSAPGLQLSRMSYNNRPPSTGYGVPQAPPLDNNYGTSYYNNPAPVYLYRGSNISYHITIRILNISTIFQATRMTSICWSSWERPPSSSSSSSRWWQCST